MAYHTTTAVERKIIRKAIEQLDSIGFKPWRVSDGEAILTPDAAAVLKAVDDVGICRAYFRDETGRKIYLELVPTKGLDIITDYSGRYPDVYKLINNLLDTMAEEAFADPKQVKELSHRGNQVPKAPSNSGPMSGFTPNYHKQVIENAKKKS